MPASYKKTGLPVVLAFFVVLLLTAAALKMTLLSQKFVEKAVVTTENVTLVQKELTTSIEAQASVLPDVTPMIEKMVSQDNVTEIVGLALTGLYQKEDFATTLARVKTLLTKTVVDTSIFGSALATTIVDLIFPSVANYLTENLAAPFARLQTSLNAAQLITTTVISLSLLVTALLLFYFYRRHLRLKNLTRTFGIGLVSWSLVFFGAGALLLQQLYNQVALSAGLTQLVTTFITKVAHLFAVSYGVLVIFGVMFVVLSFLPKPQKSPTKN